MALCGRQAHTVVVLRVRRGRWQQHGADGICICNAQVRGGLDSSRLHTAQEGTELRVNVNSDHGAFGAASSQASQFA